MERRKKRECTDDFKKQMANLYISGKVPSEIIQEYDLSAMCKCFKIPRSSYYSYREDRDIPDPLSEIVARIFNANQRV